MWEDTYGLFPLEEAYYELWTRIFAKSNNLKLKHPNNGFVSNNMQRLASQVITWWTGVVLLLVMYLSAVWTLILMAPIASIDEQVI